MRKTILSLATVASMLMAACSSSSSTGSGNFPAPPALGAEIDRMGRPLVNTALNHTFDTNDATKGAAKDEYNFNADMTTWPKYVPEFEANLAIYDALDTICGNQIFADTTKTDASRYQTLATVLSDDRIWVNAAAAACTTYLAVEANATKIITNTDCGGRKPSYEVAKLTYTLLATGQVGITVTDGTTQNPAKTQVATFPFLAPPP
ncbi:hypothetical protein AKJ09_04888 [Labilithrix luteola]|uniref:Lipoprotein n=1 Tax=Labilithrix luteola TaxID=1391654 RepID=A0A0K1PYL7_9BACT|nr:hypothetical protein [Labilithrix luteola]AKU98224.1 hypothetical protein AKJ09_04888 [Labilithrix luteola]